ncbi:hypothetical protein MTR67_035520 [Solanum verrucosum]|uniref:Uncharacterized protein n=1 Tax=Solanum verrucosum TaxID=315347 RepID=A0AAF0UAE0_SOLVR|nr:hypothetical protein MTR67_035520 [Solanum verrucosum]
MMFAYSLGLGQGTSNMAEARALLYRLKWEADKLADILASRSYSADAIHEFNSFSDLPREVRGSINTDKWELPSFKMQQSLSNSSSTPRSCIKFGIPNFKMQLFHINDHWRQLKKKSTHFLLVKTTHSTEDYAKLYLQEVTNGQAESTIQTLEDILRVCVIDFKGNWDEHLPLIKFAYNNSYRSSIQMAPYEALYERRYRSPIGWFEVGEAGLIGPNLVHQAMEKVKVIQERLKMAQSRQKSYTDVRRRELEFEVDDWVYLKVSPMKGVTRFAVHPVFHISVLNKCMGDPSLILPTEDIEIKDSLSYEEIPVQIFDRQVCKLRTKEVASVKVLWRNQFIEEATWEAEEDMKKRYPSGSTSF